MKRCPQCQSLFDDSLVYCTGDGAVLADENFVLPSEAEEETVIRRDSIRINVPANETFDDRSAAAAAAAAVPPIVVERRSGAGRQVIFLLIGLLLGGALVLATLFLTRVFERGGQTGNAVETNRAANASRAANAPDAPEPTAPTADARHLQPTAAPDEEFNGRVIALNAYVRFLPSRDAAEVDVLPINDRLAITDRANDNSPWFYVTCEHGSSGWMHGNTIEYTR